ncbi:hypothetical protein QQZ08_005981 [Neonectria magnoliae]|uniref:Uncharacterized protein n=1 Tax=Neonectria magnoliae TaxID=2732573 RepID=A0ABR1I208_9HYPO
MRSASIPASLRVSVLLCVVAFLSLATAAEPVHFSGNRQLVAGASAFVSNGIASQLPPQDRIVASDNHRSSPRLVEKMASTTFSVSNIETASLNVRAVAHVGMSILLDLASSNSVVGFLLGNGSTSTFAKSDFTDVDENGNAASGRRHITGMSVALVIVMLFFAVWM